MTLLREIQIEAIDKNADITNLLRKCTILAARLGNNEFKQWINYELNGYKPKDIIPEYRVLKVRSYGNFIGIGWQLNNHQISPSLVPEEWREFVTTVRFMDPISYYTELLEGPRNKNDIVQEPWPADLISYMSSRIIDNMQLTRAWKLVPRSAIAVVVDSVRNHILQFALEIEKEAPNAGEVESGIKPLPDEKISQVFNTYIRGNVANLASGSQNLTQSTSITVIQNDMDSLIYYLASLGVNEADLKELQEAIQTDEKSRPKNDLGAKVKSWLGTMLSKAGKGIGSIAAGIVANLITKAIFMYYGIE